MTTLRVTHLTNCTPMKPAVSLIKHADAWMDSFSVMISLYSVCKGKVIPLQARCGPEGG